MKKLLIYLLYCSTLGFFIDAQSAMPTSFITKNGESKFEIGLSASSRYYEIKNCSSHSCDGDISALSVTASKTYNINNRVDMYSSVTSHILGEISASEYYSDLSNYELDFGIRGELFNSNKVVLITYTQLKYMHISADYKGDGIIREDPKISGVEGSIGAIAITNISNKLSLYSGIEANPFNKIKISYEGYDKNNESPMEGYKAYKESLKDRKLTYRLGFDYIIDNKKYLNGEIAAGGKKAIGIKIGFVF